MSENTAPPAESISADESDTPSATPLGSGLITLPDGTVAVQIGDLPEDASDEDISAAIEAAVANTKMVVPTEKEISASVREAISMMGLGHMDAELLVSLGLLPPALAAAVTAELAEEAAPSDTADVASSAS